MATSDFDSFVEDLLSDKLFRPIIIVGAAKMDDLLASILDKYFLLPLDAKNDGLLGNDQPLSNFSSRMKLCFRLGIVDVEFYKVLEQVRKVRNLCAHRSGNLDLKTSPIREHLNIIKGFISTKDSYVLTKRRFFGDKFEHPINELHCLIIAICAILEAIFQKISKTSGLKETIAISKR